MVKKGQTIGKVASYGKERAKFQTYVLFERLIFNHLSNKAETQFCPPFSHSLPMLCFF